VPLIISAQVNDFGTWYSLGLKNKINKKTAFEAEIEYRTWNNSSTFSKSLLDLGIQRELTKDIDLSISYRYEKSFDIPESQNRHCFHSSLSYKYDIKRFDIGFRLRYMNKNSEEFPERNYSTSQSIRSRVKISYNIKGNKLEPFASIEYYYYMSKYDPDDFKKYRLTVGFSYPFKKRYDLGIYFRQQKEFNVSNPVTDYIVGFGFGYKL
jgi:predicted porin